MSADMWRPLSSDLEAAVSVPFRLSKPVPTLIRLTFGEETLEPDMRLSLVL